MADDRPAPSTSLAELLTSIGAAPLDPTTAVRTGQPSIAQHVQRLDQEVQQAQTKLHETVSGNWSTLKGQWQTGESLQRRIKEHEQELLVLEHDFQDPQDGIRVQLSRTLTSHAQLLASHSRSSALLAALSSLSPVYSLLSQLTSLLTIPSSSKSPFEDDARPLVGAVAVLKGLRSKMVDLADGWISETDLAKRAKLRASELGEEVHQRLLDVLRLGLTPLQAPSTGVSIKARFGQVDWYDVVLALDGLATKDVEKELARIAEVTLGSVLVPLLTHPPAGSSSKAKRIRTQTAEAGVQTILVEDVSPDPTATSTGSDVFHDLKSLLSTLASSLFAPRNPSSSDNSLLARFAVYLRPNLERQVVALALDPSLPSSPAGPEFSASLQRWGALLPQAKDFSSWFSSSTWVSHPAAHTGTLSSADVSIARWLETVGQRWGDSLVAKRLDRLRGEMVKCDWEGVPVDWETEVSLPEPEPEPEPEPQPAPAQVPISTPAKTAGSPSTREDSFYSSASSPVPPTTSTGGGFRSLFDFHDPVVPTSSSSDPRSHSRSPSSPHRSETPLSQPSTSSTPSRRPLSLGAGRRSMSGSISAVNRVEGAGSSLPKELFTPSPSPPSSPTGGASAMAPLQPPPPPAPASKPRSRDEYLPLEGGDDTSMMENFDDAPDEDVDWDLGGETSAPAPVLPPSRPSPPPPPRPTAKPTAPRPPPATASVTRQSPSRPASSASITRQPPSRPPSIVSLPHQPPSRPSSTVSITQQPPSRPPSTASVTRQPASRPPPVAPTPSVAAIPAPVDESAEIEEDAWGLDDDLVPEDEETAADFSTAPTPSPMPTLDPPADAIKPRPPPLKGLNGSATAQNIIPAAVEEVEDGEGDDGGGWGFDKFGQPSPSKSERARRSVPPSPAQSRLPPSPAKRNGGHLDPSTDESSPVVDDGWGFGDDEPTEEEEAAEPLRLRGGAGPADEAGEEWGWDDEDDAADAAQVAAQLGGTTITTATPQRARGRTKPGPKKVKVTEKLTVSKLAMRLADEARLVLKEVEIVGDPSFGAAELAPASHVLVQSFRDLFDLFRALMPIQHADLLATVPSLGMQYANDCDWLAKEVGKMAASWPFAAAGSDDVLGLVEKKMTALASTTREQQMTVQEAALLECLEETEGFRDPADEMRFAACERALKQVTHTLERLSHAWKPVMLPSRYSASLGQLVDFVLLRILRDIENMLDIGAGESEKLNELCKSLHGLDHLFVERPGAPTSVARFVPSWFKFSFLSELLEASMADIMWMHQEGMLSEFSTDEIVNLIRALFSDSPLRSKNIDKLLGAS